MRVAIVGGGAGGLTSLKSCKEEGIDAVCFEMSDQLGGLWGTHRPGKGVSTAYDSLITNTSKEMTAFSDHPFPEHYPTYMTRDMMYQYLLSYCERFNLMDDIKLNHKVHLVEKADDYDVTGSLLVTVEDMLSNKGKTTLKFDAVMVCTGVFSEPLIPKFKNMDKFKGKISHSHFYNSYKDFGDDEKVLVVGNYASGLDIAADLGLRKEGVTYVSARSPVAVFVRDYKQPTDTIWSLFFATVIHWLPKLYETVMLFVFKKANEPFNKFEKWLPVNGRCWGVMCDNLLNRMESGRVKSAAGLSQFTEDGVKLTDGEIIDVDRVILATGFNVYLPFISKDLVDTDCWRAYKHIWPVNSAKNTLALIGYARLLGAYLPVLELNARWAVQVFKGRCKLPTTEVMRSRSPLRQDNDTLPLVYQLSAIYVSYCADIACEIGCHPGLGYFLRNPIRWFRVYFGPAYSYVYRLVGPGSSPDAWTLINTAPSRIHSS